MIARPPPRCRRCQTNPVWNEESQLCAPCWHLLAAFGGLEEALMLSFERFEQQRRRMVDGRFDAWKAQGLAHDHDSPEFEAELRAMLDEAA